MSSSDRVQAVLLELAARARDPADLPRQLLALCRRTLPITGAGLILVSGKDVPAGVVATSDEVAVLLEDLQFTLREGPCIEASRTGHPVLVPALADPDPVRGATARWPHYTPDALAAGVAAVFAFPLRIGAIRIGVLDLHRDRAGALQDEEVAQALAIAAAATGVLLHRLDQRPPGVLTGEGTGGPWELPLARDRAVVHQATGMVSVTASLDLADALVVLRAHAYAQGRALDDVATDVVQGRMRLGRDPRPKDGPGDDHDQEGAG